MKDTGLKRSRRIAAGMAAMLCLMGAGTARAAEIKVLCAEAMKSVFNELARDFEHVGGDKVTAAYATAGVIVNRVRGGEAVDVIILPGTGFASLARDGRIAGDGTTRVARSRLAVAVAVGAAKPDIGTVDALRRTLLAAKSITYPDPTKGGGIGAMAASVIERLGLTEPLKARTILTPAGEFRDVLTRGQAELAFVLPVAVANYPGIEVVGPVPAELQDTKASEFMAGIAAQAKEPTAAKALIEYLSSPAAARIVKAKGMEAE